MTCTATFAQIAAVEALDGPQDAVEAMVEEFRARRKLIVDGLNAIPGVTCRMPHGAFYAFPNVTGTGMNGAEHGRPPAPRGRRVASSRAPRSGGWARPHLRVSYANRRENLRLALQHFGEVVAGLAVRA